MLKQRTELEWELTGIPAGGPYTLTLHDQQGAETFTNLYVGDVWLLAGQSNMEGAGRMTMEDDAYALDPNPLIRAHYMNDLWDSARPQLHQLWLSQDRAHQEAYQRDVDSLKSRKLTVFDKYPWPQRRGVGPGLYFAQEMYRLTGGIPQGVIPCAVGGAPIGMWLPPEEGTDNYFSAAVRRLSLSGGNIRGIFWSQGEGNSNWQAYPEQIRELRDAICKQFHLDALPMVQVQSFRTTLEGPPEADSIWSRFREMQRRMPDLLPNLSTIASNDLELDDCIHLSSDSQKKVGVRAANAMHYLLTGVGQPEPAIESVRATPDPYCPFFYTLRIRYKNLDGDLRANGVPSGFTLSNNHSEQAPSQHFIQRVYLEKNEVVLRTELSLEELRKRELWYGWGNSFYCNITDGADRPIPSMGPIPLHNYLTAQ